MSLSSVDSAPSLDTRASLLVRLRNWEDDVSWSEFYRLYYRLIYSFCRRSGLAHGEAEEVTQDVFRCVAENIAGFSPRPKCGSFRRWLLNLTRWRLIDHQRRQGAALPRHHPLPEPEPGQASFIDAVPDPMVCEEDSWEREWRTGVLETALERVAQKVPAKKFQVFELYARQHWPVLRIARELGINPAGVYLISHRVTKKLKREVEKLTSKIG